MSVTGLVGLGFGPASPGAAPAAPTISVTNNADGTADVTVSGATTGSSNAISHQKVGVSTWTLADTVTGNDTATISLTAGYYWFRVVSTLNSQTVVSNLVYARVSADDDSVYYQIAEAVKARLQLITFSPVTGDSCAAINTNNIYICKTEHVANKPVPSIVLSTPQHEQMQPQEGTNLRDDVEYPILVTLVLADRMIQDENQRSYTLWREQIARAFRNQRLTGVSEVYMGYINPLATVDNNHFIKQDQPRYVSRLLLNFRARETRGLT